LDHTLLGFKHYSKQYSNCQPSRSSIARVFKESVLSTSAYICFNDFALILLPCGSALDWSVRPDVGNQPLYLSKIPGFPDRVYVYTLSIAAAIRKLGCFTCTYKFLYVSDWRYCRDRTTYLCSMVCPSRLLLPAIMITLS
jgi:hypothetical protein